MTRKKNRNRICLLKPASSVKLTTVFRNSNISLRFLNDVSDRLWLEILGDRSVAGKPGKVTRRTPVKPASNTTPVPTKISPVGLNGVKKETTPAKRSPAPIYEISRPNQILWLDLGRTKVNIPHKMTRTARITSWFISITWFTLKPQQS